MKFGFDSEEKESLAIGPFTASARFGGTFRRDFKRDKGEVVTLMRFNPEGTKMLITRSHVLDGIGYDRFGCPEGFTTASTIAMSSSKTKSNSALIW